MSLIGNSYSVLSTRSAANFEKVPSTNNCGERRQTRSLYYIFKITNSVKNSVFLSDLDLANGASDARTNPGMSANSTHLKIVDFFILEVSNINSVILNFHNNIWTYCISNSHFWANLLYLLYSISTFMLYLHILISAMATCTCIIPNCLFVISIFHIK